MQKNNKKDVLIIFAISFLIVIMCLLVIYISVTKQNKNNNHLINTNNSVKKTFAYKNYKYNIPLDYEYNGNNDLLIITKNNKWYGKVYLASTKNMLITNLDDFYTFNKDNINNLNIKIYKKVINNVNTLVYEANLEKQYTICFYTNWNSFYRIFITYEDDDFNFDDLNPVVESLNNPLNLNEILDSSNFKENNN